MLFEEHEISDPRSAGCLEGTLPKCRIEISRVSERFLNSVVEIVTKRGADMRFKFYSGYKLLLDDDNEIPVLCGAEESGKSSLSCMQILAREALFLDQVRKEIHKSIKLLPARYHRTIAGVFLAGIALVPALFGSRRPEMPDRIAQSRIDIHSILRIHA